MKFKVFMIGLVLIGLWLLPQVAQASLATALLHKDQDLSTVDELTDRDWEFVTGGDATVDVGDILYGFWEVSEVNGVLPGDVGAEWFVAVFALEVDTKKDTGSGGVEKWRYGFKSVGNSTTFNQLFKAGADGDDYATDAKTAIVVYSDADGAVGTGGVVDIDEVDTTQRLWEFGFTGGDPSYTSDVDFSSVGSEFWVAKSSTDDITTLAGSANNLLYWGALNKVKGYPLLGGVDVVPFARDIDGGAGPIPSKTAELFASGNNNNQTDTVNYSLRTNTDIYINSIPEPSSVVALAGMVLMGLGLWVVRRRRG